jgi:hypothetical protein
MEYSRGDQTANEGTDDVDFVSDVKVVLTTCDNVPVEIAEGHREVGQSDGEGSEAFR